MNILLSNSKNMKRDEHDYEGSSECHCVGW